MNAPDTLPPVSPTASTPVCTDLNVFHALQARLPACETCGEKPAVDRRVLNPGAADTLMVIPGGSCNAPARLPCLHLLHASDILTIGGRQSNSCFAAATA